MGRYVQLPRLIRNAHAILDGKTKATNATKVTIEIDESISEGRLSSNNDVAERVENNKRND